MDQFRTLGKVSAYLIDRIYEENKPVFTISDAQKILSKDYNQTTDLLSEMVKRKIINRLKPGKFLIIPQEVGNVERYLGNLFIAASEVVNSPDYYIGFYSAMNHWGMLTQPLFKVFVPSPKRQVVPIQLKDNLIFIYMKEKFIWGIKEEWITQTRKIRISDLEKTILDGLLYPQHCGGITEIAKGIWITRDKIDYNKLERYVSKYGKNVVAKRLGYILEILEIADHSLLFNLKQYVKARYDLLDPAMPKTIKNKNTWRLIDNIGKNQILNIIKY
ncbi:MAG: transcriptional regulator [Actinobacteria bacterium]|nr:transcriptional regulator [Actinomycetota bacterium]